MRDFLCSLILNCMKKVDYHFSYTEYPSSSELTAEDAHLVKLAREVTQIAYAKYSQFRVGAAAILQNGEIIKGTNQENASYPVGICAERSLLAAAGTLYPGMAVTTMAISYDNKNDTTNNDHPIAPCGMCRQALQEQEDRSQQPIRLLLTGLTGPVYIIESSSQLLPLAFSGLELRK